MYMSSKVQVSWTLYFYPLDSCDKSQHVMHFAFLLSFSGIHNWWAGSCCYDHCNTGRDIFGDGYWYVWCTVIFVVATNIGASYFISLISAIMILFM